MENLPLFRSKVFASSSDRSPIRFHFQLATSDIDFIIIGGFNLQAGGVALDDPSIKLICYYKQFTTYYPYENSSPLDVQYPSSVCTYSTNELTVPAPTGGLTQGVRYELVVTTASVMNALSGLDNINTDNTLANNADKFLTFYFKEVGGIVQGATHVKQAVISKIR